MLVQKLYDVTLASMSEWILSKNQDGVKDDYHNTPYQSCISELFCLKY